MKVHRQDSHTQIEIASSLRSSLESLLQGDMVRLSREMETFDTSLVSIWLGDWAEMATNDSRNGYLERWVLFYTRRPRCRR